MMQKSTKSKRKKHTKNKKKNTKKHLTRFTIVCTSDLGNQQDSAACNRPGSR